MKLLIDAGNSRVKWAWLERGELRDPGVTPREGDEFSDIFRALRAGGQAPGKILVASVLAPASTESLANSLRRVFSVPVQVAVTEPAAAGVRNGYVDHRQMGVDRWLAMVAAFARFRTAVCVVDAGTAVTIDAVAADGSHQGGLIVPGPSLMRDVLLRRTAGIGLAAERRVDATPQPGRWGRDTDSCIELGSVRATACLVEHCMKALQSVEGHGAVLVVTGGDAPVLLGALSIAAEHRPLLVLEGLALRYGSD